MKEVRSWLDDTEMILKFLQGEKDPSNENKIHETIEASFFVYLLMQYSLTIRQDAAWRSHDSANAIN